MPFSAKVNDWSIETTCLWFQHHGFHEPKLLKSMMKFKLDASFILKENLTFEDLGGTVTPLLDRLYQIRIEELKLRNQKENAIISTKRRKNH